MLLLCMGPIEAHMVAEHESENRMWLLLSKIIFHIRFDKETDRNEEKIWINNSRKC